jgi:hypothetical protein
MLTASPKICSTTGYYLFVPNATTPYTKAGVPAGFSSYLWNTVSIDFSIEITAPGD